MTDVIIKKELELSNWEAYWQVSEQRGQSPLLTACKSPTLVQTMVSS